MTLRLLIALTLFIGLAFGSSWFLFQNIESIKNSFKPAQNLLTTQKGEPVFYSFVGKGPKIVVDSEPAVQSTQFSIETAVFMSQSEAEEEVDILSAAGFKAFYTPYQKGGRVIYRVRIGVFARQDEAKIFLEKLAKTGVKAQLVQL